MVENCDVRGAYVGAIVGMDGAFDQNTVAGNKIEAGRGDNIDCLVAVLNEEIDSGVVVVRDCAFERYGRVVDDLIVGERPDGTERGERRCGCPRRSAQEQDER